MQLAFSTLGARDYVTIVNLETNLWRCPSICHNVSRTYILETRSWWSIISCSTKTIFLRIWHFLTTVWWLSNWKCKHIVDVKLVRKWHSRKHWVATIKSCFWAHWKLKCGQWQQVPQALLRYTMTMLKEDTVARDYGNISVVYNASGGGIPYWDWRTTPKQLTKKSASDLHIPDTGKMIKKMNQTPPSVPSKLDSSVNPKIENLTHSVPKPDFPVSGGSKTR